MPIAGLLCLLITGACSRTEDTGSVDANEPENEPGAQSPQAEPQPERSSLIDELSTKLDATIAKSQSLAEQAFHRPNA